MTPTRVALPALLALALVLPFAPAVSAAGQTRCGWVDNPTPGNWWLTDRQTEWTLATQGREGVPGFDDMPDFSDGDWVQTNGHYGYGCGCMEMVTQGETVVSIADIRQLPLATCEADPALPRR